MNFSGFNLWEILVAAVAAFVIGGVWYSPWLFGPTWQRLLGLSDEAMQKRSPAVIFGVSFVLLVIIATFLSFFVEVATMIGSNAWSGAMAGTFVCLAFVATALGVNYLFARHPFKLYLIDAGYFLVTFIVMGIIIGVWT